MLDYCRLDLFSQTTTITFGSETDQSTVLLNVDDTPTVFQGNPNEIADLMKESGAVEVSVNGQTLILKSSPPGYSFIVDTPIEGIILSTVVEEDFVLLLPENIPLNIHRTVLAYHLELQTAIQGMPVYPPETDSVIYPRYKRYYEKILELICPRIHPDRLSYDSRHAFFIGTDPAPNPDGKNSDNLTMGLPQLSILMGYKISNEKDEATEEEDVVHKPSSTGDSVLDIETDILLIFKSAAPYLLAHHGIENLGKIAMQANARMKESQEKAEKQSREEKERSIPEDEAFTQRKPQIVNRLKLMKVPLPDCF